MERFTGRRPSASLVVAIIALVVAASGTAIAASSETSGDSIIKKKSLSGNRLKDDTVTGRQIKESSLGKVPKARTADSATSAGSARNAISATSATTATNAVNAVNATNAVNASNASNATNAGNAQTVDGRAVTTFKTIIGRNASQTVLASDGFTLSLACDGSGKPTLTGTSATAHAMVRGMKVTLAATSAQVIGLSDTTANVPVALMGPSDSRGTVSVQYATASGPVVSVNAYVDDTNTVGQTDGCSATGSAISG